MVGQTEQRLSLVTPQWEPFEAGGQDRDGDSVCLEYEVAHSGGEIPWEPFFNPHVTPCLFACFLFLDKGDEVVVCRKMVDIQGVVEGIELSTDQRRLFVCAAEGDTPEDGQPSESSFDFVVVDRDEGVVQEEGESVPMLLQAGEDFLPDIRRFF